MLSTIFTAVAVGVQTTDFIELLKDALRPIFFPQDTSADGADGATVNGAGDGGDGGGSDGNGSDGGGVDQKYSAAQRRGVGFSIDPSA
jgi:hypothetical protein